MRQRARSLARALHRWLGLSLGLLWLVIGLSGSALVFYVDIDRWLHPVLASGEMRGEPDWDSAVATLRATFPDKRGPWRLEVTGDGGAIPVRYYNPPETRGEAFAPMMVWLSPDGRRVLRQTYWGRHLMTWLYNLHFQLLAGSTGAIVVGYLGLASLLLLLAGAAAWWPRPGAWRKSLRMKSGAAPVRALYDWHKLIGLTAALPLLLLSATGAMLALPQETDQLLALVGQRPATPTPPAPVDPAPLRISPSQALQRARIALPAARIAWLEVPAVSGGSYSVRMQVKGDPSYRFPHSRVWIDAATGAVAGRFDLREQSAANTLKSWLHPLHAGSVGALPLRLCWLVCGIAAAALSGLGLLRWLLRQRRARRVAAGR